MKNKKHGTLGGTTTHRVGVNGRAAGIPKKRATLWIQEDVFKALQIWAIENDSTLSDAVEYAVAKLLKLV